MTKWCHLDSPYALTEEEHMQDKSFQQALQELRDRLSDGLQETLWRMIQDRTTATQAASSIQEDHMRAIVTQTIIVGQMIVLLLMMKEMGIIYQEQYDEFVAYLRCSLVCQPHKKTGCGNYPFLSEAHR
jgi:hypothetical protein